MPTTLILIRHGETNYNRQRKYCGFTDIGLNKKGREQARQVSEILGKERIHKICSSDAKRTLQFAKIALKNAAIEKFSELREMNFGIFEGLTYEQITHKYSEIYRRWLDNPLKVRVPDGESLSGLAKRTRKVVAKILSFNKNKTIAIFTHAGPIKVILCDILKLSLKEIWQIESKSASISKFEFVKGKVKVHLLNDISHLNG